MQTYSDPKRASDPGALPDVEVWYHTNANDGSQMELPTGWYWQPLFLGRNCAGADQDDPNGPFNTEAEALADAQTQNQDGDK